MRKFVVLVHVWSFTALLAACATTGAPAPGSAQETSTEIGLNGFTCSRIFKDDDLVTPVDVQRGGTLRLTEGHHTLWISAANAEPSTRDWTIEADLASNGRYEIDGQVEITELRVDAQGSATAINPRIRSVVVKQRSSGVEIATGTQGHHVPERPHRPVAEQRTTAPACSPVAADDAGPVVIGVPSLVANALGNLPADAAFFTSRACPLESLSDIRVTGEQLGVWGVELMPRLETVMRAAGVSLGAGGKGMARLPGDDAFPSLFIEEKNLRLFLTHRYSDHREKAIVERGGGVPIRFEVSGA